MLREGRKAAFRVEKEKKPLHLAQQRTNKRARLRSRPITSLRAAKATLWRRHTTESSDSSAALRSNQVTLFKRRLPHATAISCARLMLRVRVDNILSYYTKPRERVEKVREKGWPVVGGVVKTMSRFCGFVFQGADVAPALTLTQNRGN